MAKLTDEQKLFIVHALACFDTPSIVVEAFKEEFGVTLERSHIQLYDPNRAQGKTLSKKYRDIFEATRQAFLAEQAQIPIANKTYRLRSLQHMHDFYSSRKNFVQAQSVLEQAAKEVGGMYTNKLQLGGDKDNPLLVAFKQLVASNSAIPIAHEVEGELIEQD